MEKEVSTPVNPTYVVIPSEFRELKAIGLSNGLRVSIASYGPHAAVAICDEMNKLAQKSLSRDEAEAELRRIGIDILPGRRTPGVRSE